MATKTSRVAAEKKEHSTKTEHVDFSWRMGGEAGTGIKNAAEILARAFVASGYYVHANVEFPSIIRGGNNALEVRMSNEPVRSLMGETNLLAALDALTVEMWLDHVVQGGSLLVDTDVVDLKAFEEVLDKKKIKALHVPLTKLLGDANLPPIMLNTVMLGAIIALVCHELKPLNKELEQVFGRKGKKIVEANQKAAKLGYDYFASQHKHDSICQPRAISKQRTLLDGGAAATYGALKAGMTFYSGYPMTPASTLLHNSAALKEKYNVVVYQPEDEIASIQMAIGASYAGARAMTASSGGGFSLMVESLGLAAMTETPLVVALAMRPGPATGLPTRTGQGDLRFALHAHQDQPPRVVLAPGDPEECFELMFHAHNIADAYQLLVIFLTDKYVLESLWTSASISEEGLEVDRGKILSVAEVSKLKSYERFAITEDGVSPRVLPGTPGLVGISRVSGNEHNPAGFIEEDAQNRVEIMDKRRRKVATAYSKTISKMDPIRTYGDQASDRVIISFGSNKGVILDSLDELKRSGENVRAIMVRCLEPFPVKEVTAALKNAKDVLVLEGNDSGQFEGLLREKTGVLATGRMRYYDGRPPTMRDVVSFIGNKGSKP